MSAAERATASRRAQGLPARITDPAALSRIATLLRATPAKSGGGAR